MTAGTMSAPRIRRRRNERERREIRAAVGFLAPDVAGLTVFLAVPMLLTFVLGFFRISGFGEYEFIGLANFRRMFGDPQFLGSLGRTAIYLGVLTPVLFVAALLLALLVKQRFPLVGLFRSAFFVPYVVSLVVVGLVWQFVLTDKVGILSRLVEPLGIAPSWLGDPTFALASVIAISVWYQMGYYMIIFLAGLQDIPREYYEAARIDGAGPWQAFRDVTWPLLKPTSFFVLLTSVIAAITGGFDLIYILTNGGPANATTVVIIYIFQQAFVFGEFGYAAAMSSFLVLAMLALSVVIFRVTQGGRFSYAD